MWAKVEGSKLSNMINNEEQSATKRVVWNNGNEDNFYTLGLDPFLKFVLCLFFEGPSIPSILVIPKFQTPPFEKWGSSITCEKVPLYFGHGFSFKLDSRFCLMNYRLWGLSSQSLFRIFVLC
jgi:hypothetical protein